MRFIGVSKFNQVKNQLKLTWCPLTTLPVTCSSITILKWSWRVPRYMALPYYLSPFQQTLCMFFTKRIDSCYPLLEVPVSTVFFAYQFTFVHSAAATNFWWSNNMQTHSSSCSKWKWWSLEKNEENVRMYSLWGTNYLLEGLKCLVFVLECTVSTPCTRTLRWMITVLLSCHAACVAIPHMKILSSRIWRCTWYHYWKENIAHFCTCIII